MPKPKLLPPVRPAYHKRVPTDAVAPKITVPVPVLEPGKVAVTVGVAKIVTVFVEVSLAHKALNAVSVKVTFPAAISDALGV